MNSSRKYVKRQTKKAVKKVAKKHPVLTFFVILVLIACIVGGYFVYNKYFKKKVPIVGEFSVHFLTLGNDYAGDSIYIKAGENDILIDAGSKTDSVDDISNYIDQYVSDNTLEFVIATHADTDHIAGFSNRDSTNSSKTQSIFDLYVCKTIIDFPLTNKTTQTYNEYLLEREDEIKEGAIHYNALECYKEQNGAKRVYSLGESMSMEILYNYYYEHPSDKENNYSVCLLFRHGDKQFLFTGDLEKKGEEYLAEKYNFTQVDLFKAGHHGSITSSNEVLLNEIQPAICVVTCSAGENTYGAAQENIFPSQEFINRISEWTESVYVTTLGDDDFTGDKDFMDMNGNVIISSTEKGIQVICSNNSTLLKDTEWFKARRTTPPKWQ